MNIAITSENGKNVTSDTETCQHFQVYEIAAGKVLHKHMLSLGEDEVLGKSDLIHENHPLDGVRVLISSGMGKKISKRLEMIGITPFVTDETDPDAAVNHYLHGDLHVEPAGLHKRHDFHLLKDESNYAPAAGTKELHDIV